jgi:hypothetical protein
MDEDRTVLAHFAPQGGPDVADQASAGAVGLRSTLAVRGGKGEVGVNGSASSVREGEAHLNVTARPGDNLVEAWLSSAGSGGSWRFDVVGRDPLASGTLRVLAGNVVSLGPGSVTFRLSGREGERVAFAWTSVRDRNATRP